MNDKIVLCGTVIHLYKILAEDFPVISWFPDLLILKDSLVRHMEQTGENPGHGWASL